MTTTNMFLNFGGKWDSPLKCVLYSNLGAWIKCVLYSNLGAWIKCVLYRV